MAIASALTGGGGGGGTPMIRFHWLNKGTVPTRTWAAVTMSSVNPIPCLNLTLNLTLYWMLMKASGRRRSEGETGGTAREQKMFRTWPGKIGAASSLSLLSLLMSWVLSVPRGDFVWSSVLLVSVDVYFAR